MLTVKLKGHAITTSDDEQVIIINGQRAVITTEKGKIKINGSPLKKAPPIKGITGT